MTTWSARTRSAWSQSARNRPVQTWPVLTRSALNNSVQNRPSLVSICRTCYACLGVPVSVCLTRCAWLGMLGSIFRTQFGGINLINLFIYLSRPLKNGNLFSSWRRPFTLVEPYSTPWQLQARDRIGPKWKTLKKVM